MVFMKVCFPCAPFPGTQQLSTDPHRADVAVCFKLNEAVVTELAWSKFVEGRHVSKCATSNSSNAVNFRVGSEDPEGSVTSSKGIRGYISLMATFKRNYYIILSFFLSFLPSFFPSSLLVLLSFFLSFLLSSLWYLTETKKLTVSFRPKVSNFSNTISTSSTLWPINHLTL